MSSQQIVEITRLYLGRGLAGDPLEAGLLEVSVDIDALGPELEQALRDYEVLPRRVWLPLTTVVAGEPVLVWGADDALIPTSVPTPHLGAEDMSSGIGDTTPTEGEPPP